MGTRAHIAGLLEAPGGAVALQIVEAARHSLSVRFTNGVRPSDNEEFSVLRLQLESREIALGRCRYQANGASQARRANDKAVAGDGRLIFLDQLYDFASLESTGTIVELHKRLEQLPVLWGRKNEIRPAFRELTAETVFDIQVFRSLFDEIDRNLCEEPPSVRNEVHRVVGETQYEAFRKLFDRKLGELDALVRAFTREEHERHGFYLRKHVWDIILASEFFRRTNLKPRGYAGDSEMMRLVYENQFAGPTIFSRFVHRHPIQTAAAQAVRNRVRLLGERIGAAARARSAPLRVMSVAAGPAWELKQLLCSPEEFRRYEITLLDQDPQALAEARALVDALELQHGAKATLSLVKDSVRTMLRSVDLAQKWGRFGFLYSMGLFDYLTAPVARVVLRRLYELLEPGGELVVGNFHVSNPTRTYMEYWMDWVLVYRTETEMLELANGIPGADASVIFEDTGSQMFLCVRKPS